MMKLLKNAQVLFISCLFTSTIPQPIINSLQLDQGFSNGSNSSDITTPENNHVTTMAVTNTTHKNTTKITNRDKPMREKPVVTWILLVVVGTGIALLGLIGNCLSVSVLASPKMRSSNSVILIFLAFFDSLILIRYILFIPTPDIMLQYMSSSQMRNIFSIPVNVIFRPIEHIGHVGAMYTTVLLTAERFVVILFPFRAITLCTVARAKIFCLIIFLFSFIFNLPRMFVSTLEIHPDPVTNSSKFVNIKNNHSDEVNFFYNVVYADYLRSIFLIIIPPIFLITLNSCVIFKLFRLSRDFKQNNSAKFGGKCGVSDKVTGMTMAIILTFCVSLTVFHINRKMCHVDKNSITPDMCQHFRAPSELIYILNSAINIVYYCLFGARFRKALVSRFSCCTRKKVTTQTQISTTSL